MDTSSLACGISETLDHHVLVLPFHIHHSHYASLCWSLLPSWVNPWSVSKCLDSHSDTSLRGLWHGESLLPLNPLQPLLSNQVDRREQCMLLEEPS